MRVSRSRCIQWTEDKTKKVAAIAALTLAAVCPFTTIYVATILTEVPTSFLAVLLCLVSTLAFKAPDSTRNPALDRSWTHRRFSSVLST
jgi:hypothetical protein